MNKDNLSNLFKEYIGTISESIEGYNNKNYNYALSTGYNVIKSISAFLNDYYKKDGLVSFFKNDAWGYFGPNLTLRFGHFDGRFPKKDGIYIYIEFPKEINQTEYSISLELGNDARYLNNSDAYNKNVLALQELINFDSNKDKYSNYISKRIDNNSIVSYKINDYDLIPDLIDYIKNEYYFPILNKIKLKDGYWVGEEWENFQKELFKDNYYPIIKNKPINNKKNNSDENIYNKSQIQKDKDNKEGFNRIYYGVPGSGKSHFIEKNLNTIVGTTDENIIKVRTVFYPDYSNSDFVGQIMPISENNELKYKPIPGPFTKALKEAVNNVDKKVVLIIEEINRGNASAIFGDIFQLLDRNVGNNVKFTIDNNFVNQYSKLAGNDSLRQFIEDNNGLTLPNNLYIIGTMNTSDQNVYTLDTAFKRRWEMCYISNGFDDIDFIGKMVVPNSNGVLWSTFVEKINNAILEKSNQIIQGEDKQIGKYFVSKNYLIDIDDNVDLKSMDEEDRISFCRDFGKFAKFKDKVLVYLFEDVTKYNHAALFKDNINRIDDLMNKSALEEILKVSFDDE